MRFLKLAVVALLAYVALVVTFETYLGIAQPRFHKDAPEEWDATIVITTVGADGASESRVVSPIVSDGVLYASANHWPRSWYNRVLKNPQVRITNRDQTKAYLAVPIPAGSDEDARLEHEHPHPAWFRFLTGYPPRRFVRFQPQ